MKSQPETIFASRRNFVVEPDQIDARELSSKMSPEFS